MPGSFWMRSISGLASSRSLRRWRGAGPRAGRSRRWRTPRASRRAADTSCGAASPGWACAQSWARSSAPAPRDTPGNILQLIFNCDTSTFRSVLFSEIIIIFFIYLELNLLAVRPGLGLAAGGVLDLAGEGVGHPHVGHLLGLVVPDLPWRISRYYLVRQHVSSVVTASCLVAAFIRRGGRTDTRIAYLRFTD